MAEDRGPSLMEALSQYLAGLKDGKQPGGQQEVNRFIKWCGSDRVADKLTPAEVAEYAESAGLWGADSAKKLLPVKSFLTFMRQRGITAVSLAPHLKAPGAKGGAKRVYVKHTGEQAELSPEGHKKLQSRLELLKDERIKVRGDVQRAMADKDFKENAPLDAAKERQGYIEAGIKELEGILANAVVTSGRGSARGRQIMLGRKVTLKDVDSGRLVVYTLVDPRESDPLAGKLSSVSPVGKALLDRVIGEEIHVTVPKGIVRYIIHKVEG